MDEETLTKSIGYYESQLDQVNEALDKSTDITTRDDLEKLRNDIKELLQLTKASLLAVKKQQLLESVEPVAPETKHSEQGSSQDDEYSLFEAELADAVTSKNNTDQSAEELQKDLASLEGSKCRAPFSHQWGQMNFCNAVVLQVEPNDSINSMNDIKVRVMFCNPFSQAMQPCPYFLDGKCRFSDEKCRYSHGHVVNFQELQEFKEPDFSYLQKDSKCFAKHNDGLWHLAIVEEEEADHHFTVKFTEFGTTAIVSVEDILPLDEESNDDSSDSDAEVYLNISNEFRNEDEIKPMVFDISTTKAMGGWEQHTKGIGSKLMMQMGYITGQGLGKHGEGRTEPIEAVILPAGKSLDKCMELKEKGSLQNPERKKKRLLKKEKLKAARIAAGYNYKPKQSVFDFLNSKLSGKPGLKSEGDSQSTTPASKQSLKATTSQKLNVEALRISDGIRKTEKEIASLRKSLERNQDKDRTMSSHLRQQISVKEDHLKQLQKSEHAVHREQTKRNDTKKLTLF